MTETSTLNFQYPSLQTLTSIIVQRAVAVMLDDGYKGKEFSPLMDYIIASFELYPWEPQDADVRQQVMRELEFIGFAW